MIPFVLEEPLERLDAVPGLYGINGEPMTRQNIVLLAYEEDVIAALDKEQALALANRLLMLADQIQPGTTGWAIDGDDWRPQLRRLASVDDELRDRDA